MAKAKSAVVSEQDEAEILESLLQRKSNPLARSLEISGLSLPTTLVPVSATRIEKQGFSLMASGDIQRFSSDHVIEYLVIRSIYRRDGFVVVRLSAVTEGQPCFARAFH